MLVMAMVMAMAFYYNGEEGKGTIRTPGRVQAQRAGLGWAGLGGTGRVLAPTLCRYTFLSASGPSIIPHDAIHACHLNP